jgi:hypothetical protein
MNCPSCNKPLDLGLTGYYPCKCKQNPSQSSHPHTSHNDYLGTGTTIVSSLDTLEITSMETNIGRVVFTNPMVIPAGFQGSVAYRKS